MFTSTFLLATVVVFYTCLQCSSGAHKILNLPEGSKCAFDKYNGTCIKDYKCLSMIKSIKTNNIPPICSFVEDTPVICCTDCPIRMDIDIRNATFTPAAGLLFKTGQKFYDKCIDYLLEYQYKCRRHNTFTYAFDWYEPLKCTAYSVGALAPVGGDNAVRGEFPHMALLGYGPAEESLEWQCGGSLISDRYILTAAHCISSVRLGPVKYVALGMLKRSDPIKLWRLYKVKSIIPHPGYQSPLKYDDIALLETETIVKIDTLVLPACLGTEEIAKSPYANIHATGWGNLGKGKPEADTLQKVKLKKFTDDECANMYPVHRLLPRGYDNVTQVCYGDRYLARDTCTGDSGGPIQDIDHIGCQFSIIGLTSTGIPCGEAGNAGLYTRLDPYLPWIESIVWP